MPPANNFNRKTKARQMDIANIVPTEKTVEIRHPADENLPLGIRVSVMSATDPRMKGIKRAVQDAKLRLDARNKHFKADELETNLHNMVFAAMTEWDWYGENANFEGEKPEFNKANVFKIFAKLEWFLDQLIEAIQDEKSFFQNSKAI